MSRESAGGEGPSAKAPSGSLFARARPLVLARAASAGLSFAIPLVLARSFAQDDYGTYKLLFLISAVLYHILPMGMAQSLYYFLPRAKFRRPFLFQTLLYLLGAGTVAMLGIVGLKEQIGLWVNNAAVAEYALWLGVYTLGLIGAFPLEIVLTARGQTGRAAAVYILSDLVKAVVMIAPALLGFGLRGVMIGNAIFALLRLAATWGLLLEGEEGGRLDKGAWWAQLRYSLPFGAAVCMAIPQQYFHQFVVSSRLDAASFAIYAVGIFQLPIIDLLYTPTTEVLMVRVAELEREGRMGESIHAFREAVSKLAGFFVPSAVFLIAAAPEFITALFTERYLASVPVFRIVALGILLAIPPLDGVLRARNETRFIFFSYAVKLAAAIPLVLLGVNAFGMLGAVGSWLLTEALGKVLLLMRVPRALGVRLHALAPWPALVRIGAAALLACVGILAARAAFTGLGHAAITLAVAGTLYGIAYLVTLMVLGGELPIGHALAARLVARLQRSPGQPRSGT